MFIVFFFYFFVFFLFLFFFMFLNAFSGGPEINNEKKQYAHVKTQQKIKIAQGKTRAIKIWKIVPIIKLRMSHDIHIGHRSMMFPKSKVEQHMHTQATRKQLNAKHMNSSKGASRLRLDQSFEARLRWPVEARLRRPGDERQRSAYSVAFTSRSLLLHASLS